MSKQWPMDFDVFLDNVPVATVRYLTVPPPARKRLRAIFPGNRKFEGFFCYCPLPQPKRFRASNGMLQKLAKINKFFNSLLATTDPFHSCKGRDPFGVSEDTLGATIKEVCKDPQKKEMITCLSRLVNLSPKLPDALFMSPKTLGTNVFGCKYLKHSNLQPAVKQEEQVADFTRLYNQLIWEGCPEQAQQFFDDNGYTYKIVDRQLEEFKSHFEPNRILQLVCDGPTLEDIRNDPKIYEMWSLSKILASACHLDDRWVLCEWMSEPSGKIHRRWDHLQFLNRTHLFEEQIMRDLIDNIITDRQVYHDVEVIFKHDQGNDWYQFPGSDTPSQWFQMGQFLHDFSRHIAAKQTRASKMLEMYGKCLLKGELVLYREIYDQHVKYLENHKRLLLKKEMSSLIAEL